MPFAQATWLGAQRPGSLREDGLREDGLREDGLREDGLREDGLQQDGSMGQWGIGGTGGTIITGYSYDGPSNPAWQSADLAIEVAPAGSDASVIRADGQVVWLDPVPEQDLGSARRMRVTVAGGCPDSDAGFADVANSGLGLTGRLLPGTAPAAGLECRYYGLNGHAWRLRSATRLNAAAASRVASSMARIPLSHPEGAVLNCPLDDDSAEVIALSYPGRPDVDLWISLTGCGGVSNGYILAG
jgi:hypothetical protein